MHRFYVSEIALDTPFFTLNEEESKHACRVLRLKIGDAIELVDGRGNLFSCTITEDHPKRCTISVNDVYSEPKLPYSLHVALAPTKNMDRMEWFVEKATEIGVTHVSFLRTKNSERQQLKLDRLEKIAISAMKQSKRLVLPTLFELVDFNSFVSAHPNGLIAHCIEGKKGSIREDIRLENCPILIGPEGDFTMDEIDFAFANGYKPVTLGSHRLRTETAALYACVEAALTFEI
jgi:16S rRNA (uracil1498-N3)-methyltransferase